MNVKNGHQNQRDLPIVGQEFNLVQETGDDPVRVIMDRLREAEARAAAREYELRMQRTFSQCPGFLSGDAPQSELGRGHVVIESAKMTEALPWLKRRFQISETLEADLANGGLRVQIAPRVRRRSGIMKRQGKADFRPIEQFVFNL